MPIYLKLGEIEGDANDQGFEGWLITDTIHLMASRDFAGSLVSDTRREDAKTQISEVVLTREVSPSASALLEVNKPQHVGELAVVQVITDPGYADLECRLTEPMVSLSQDERGTAFTETFRFRCTKIDLKCTPHCLNNQPQTPWIGGYDLLKATSF